MAAGNGPRQEQREEGLHFRRVRINPVTYDSSNWTQDFALLVGGRRQRILADARLATIGGAVHTHERHWRRRPPLHRHQWWHPRHRPSTQRRRTRRRPTLPHPRHTAAQGSPPAGGARRPVLDRRSLGRHRHPKGETGKSGGARMEAHDTARRRTTAVLDGDAKHAPLGPP